MRRNGKAAEADALEQPSPRVDKARIKEQAAAAVATAKSATEKRKSNTVELLAKLAQPKGVDFGVDCREERRGEAEAAR
jgi:hypothetical protein